MKFSQLFSQTQRQGPADETAKNAQLLIRAGFIHKEMAGVYAYLPLGLRVLDNIRQIIREEMNVIGGQELIMTTLQRPELWAKTDRWDDAKVDIWFKTKLKNNNELGLSWSHEEPITDMMRSFIESYRDLPAYVYQFQTKLRNELRVKSGIMRGREFVMKDLYSYSPNEAVHQQFYDQVKIAYMKVFSRVGLGDATFETFASGGDFTQFSHEFQTVTPNGEDIIHLDRAKKIAVNQEVLNDDVLAQLELKRDDLEEVKAEEVGNIFSFGTTKSETLDLYFTDENGQRHPAVLGSYGIGVTRLMGVIAEHMSDDRGLIWPESIAPFIYHMVAVGSEEAFNKAASIYEQLTKANQSVLFDDRLNVSAGAKFADADLLGMPLRLVVSDKTGEQIEYKKRSSPDTKLVSTNSLLQPE